MTEQVQVNIKLDENAKVPVYATIHAAGCDFYALESGVVKADTVVGVKKEPVGYYAIVENGVEIHRFSEEESKKIHVTRKARRTSSGDLIGGIFKGIEDLLEQGLKMGGYDTSKLDGLRFVQTGEQDVECAFNDPEAYRLKIKKHPLIISTGVYLEIPNGMELELRGRSGLGFKHNLMPHNGTIDADYRGEVKIKIFNLGEEDFHFEAGDRIAQGVFKNIVQVKFNVVDELSETERGEGGLGSTGLK